MSNRRLMIDSEGYSRGLGRIGLKDICLIDMYILIIHNNDNLSNTSTENVISCSNACLFYNNIF